MSASGFRVVLRSLRYPQESRGHGDPLSELKVMFPSQGSASTLAAFAPLGPGAEPVPHHHRSYAAIRLPMPLQHASGLPSAMPYQSRKRWFCAPRRFVVRPAVGPLAADGASEWVTGSPSPGSVDWTVRGLPGYRAVFFGRATVVHPAGPPSARP